MGTDSGGPCGLQVCCTQDTALQVRCMCLGGGERGKGGQKAGAVGATTFA
jgi:hypothetical protein